MNVEPRRNDGYTGGTLLLYNRASFFYISFILEGSGENTSISSRGGGRRSVYSGIRLIFSVGFLSLSQQNHQSTAVECAPGLDGCVARSSFAVFIVSWERR